MFIKNFLKAASLIACICAESPINAAASSVTEWTMHDLDAGFGYEMSAVEVYEYRDTLFTQPSPPSKLKSQAVMAYNEELESLLVPEKLLRPGVDGRKQILDTDKFPYSIHGQMSMNFSERRYGGSGVLIGPHHFLTAGHCVYNRSDNWATDIRIRLGLNGGSAPFNEMGAVRVYVSKKWLEKKCKEYDMALIVLDHSVGYETGWSGLLSLPDAELLTEKVHVTGYPGDKGFNEMWTMEHTLSSVVDERLSYEIDTAGAQSGGAVWVKKGRVNPFVVGVHTYGGAGINHGVRLSHSKLRAIVAQIKDTWVIKAPAGAGTGAGAGSVSGAGAAASPVRAPDTKGEGSAEDRHDVAGQKKRQRTEDPLEALRLAFLNDHETIGKLSSFDSKQISELLDRVKRSIRSDFSGFKKAFALPIEQEIVKISLRLSQSEKFNLPGDLSSQYWIREQTIYRKNIQLLEEKIREKADYYYEERISLWQRICDSVKPLVPASENDRAITFIREAEEWERDWFKSHLLCLVSSS